MAAAASSQESLVKRNDRTIDGIIDASIAQNTAIASHIYIMPTHVHAEVSDTASKEIEEPRANEEGNQDSPYIAYLKNQLQQATTDLLQHEIQHVQEYLAYLQTLIGQKDVTRCVSCGRIICSTDPKCSNCGVQNSKAFLLHLLKDR